MMDIRSQAKLLFERYNEYMEHCSEEILERESETRDIFGTDFEKDFNKMVEEQAAAFLDHPLEGLEAGTPKKFFENLATADEAIEVFRIAAGVSDVKPPKYLTDRIFSFGEPAVDKMILLAVSTDWEIGESVDPLDARDLLLPSSSAVRALGENHIEKSIGPILDRFCKMNAPDEYISDVVSEYLVNIGPDVTDELMRRVDSTDILPANGPEEDLMVALAKIGAGHRSEAVFQSLRGAFRKMERKVIGALCLGDYGDGRAVPLLKGYLDRNLHTVSREMFYETLTVIRKLGGDINDVQDPFKDFSKK
jgi:hypothetical protein